MTVEVVLRLRVTVDGSGRKPKPARLAQMLGHCLRPRNTVFGYPGTTLHYNVEIGGTLETVGLVEVVEMDLLESRAGDPNGLR